MGEIPREDESKTGEISGGDIREVYRGNMRIVLWRKKGSRGPWSQCGTGQDQKAAEETADIMGKTDEGRDMEFRIVPPPDQNEKSEQ